MPQPRVLVLRAPGTNCDAETAFAFERAGGAPHVAHVNRLLEKPALLADFQVLCIPGGFSYGDDVAAGRILASQMQNHLRDELLKFRDDGKLVLGICNGFQVLLKSGLLLEEDAAGPPATLTWNDRGRYEDRWVHVQTEGDRCVFLRGVASMYLPIAHAEGKFIVRDEATLARLRGAGQFCLRYSAAESRGSAQSSADAELDFPHNPNGSQANVAGVCDASGRIFGLMPHPERHLEPTNHPQWTRRKEQPAEGDGLAMFRNAVEYFHSA
jgi:phosphoribosylformylglycinamidine synthase